MSKIYLIFYIEECSYGKITTADEALQKNGNWHCTCGRTNPSYTFTCVCGKNKKEIKTP